MYANGRLICYWFDLLSRLPNIFPFEMEFDFVVKCKRICMNDGLIIARLTMQKVNDPNQYINYDEMDFINQWTFISMLE